MWTVVIFTEEDTTEAVPLQWLINDKLCYWPPLKGIKLNSAIANEDIANSNWSIYDIRFPGGKKKIYDDFLRARNVSKKVTVSSDVDTDFSTKRVIKRKRKFDDSSDDNASDTSDDALPAYPTAPKQLTMSQSICGKEINNSSSGSKKPTTFEDVSGNECCENNYSQMITETMTAPKNVSQEFDRKEFEVQLIRKINLINNKVDLISKDITSIMEVVSKNFGDTGVQATSDMDYTNFPLDIEENLMEFEASLAITENYRKFVRYITSIGGISPYEAAKRALSRIFTDNLASQYSWQGKKKKKVFGSLQLAKAIIEGMQANHGLKNNTEKDLEEAIKSWLRHAKDRQKTNNNKAN